MGVCSGQGGPPAPPSPARGLAPWALQAGLPRPHPPRPASLWNPFCWNPPHFPNLSKETTVYPAGRSAFPGGGGARSLRGWEWSRPPHTGEAPPPHPVSLGQRLPSFPGDPRRMCGEADPGASRTRLRASLAVSGGAPHWAPPTGRWRAGCRRSTRTGSPCPSAGRRGRRATASASRW